MIQMLRVKGWKDFQHYKGRRPPWIKLHRQLLDDYEFHRLPLASKALAPMLWLLASEYEGGAIPWSLEQVAFRMRMTEGELQQAVTPLISTGFFTLDAGRSLDASAPLAERQPDAMPEERRGETEKEAEAEAERPRRRQIDRCRAEMPEPYREALDGALRSARNPDALAAEICMIVDGGHGKPYPFEVVGKAIHDMQVGGVQMGANALRAFCRNAAEPARASPSDPVAAVKEQVEELRRKREERMRRPA